jgi:hypothetical protein
MSTLIVVLSVVSLGFFSLKNLLVDLRVKRQLQYANGLLLFQALLTFSPVSVALPLSYPLSLSCPAIGGGVGASLHAARAIASMITVEMVR